MIDEEEKIPYDSEPIARYKNMGMLKESKRKSNDSKTKRSLSILLAIFFAVNSGLFIFIFVLFKKVEGLEKESPIYNMSIDGSTVDLSYATAKGMISTVSVAASISNNCNSGTKFFSNDMSSRGSGVIMQMDKTSGDAYIMTNQHVVLNSTTTGAFSYIWIMLWDSLVPIPATYVGGSTIYDIAVLYIENSEEIKNTSSNPAEIALSETIVAGQSCIAIGNSRAKNLRITTGVISVEEDVLNGTYSNYNFFISHSADVNSGNSGGGLYDSHGKLLGIVNAKFNDTSSSGYLIFGEVVHGMYYAIPSSMAYSIARNIIDNGGDLKKASLGLVYGTSYGVNDKSVVLTDSNYIQTQYTLVITQDIGNFKNGDILSKMKYSYGGEERTIELNRLFSIENNIFNLRRGDNVKFEVLRGNSTIEINVNNISVTTIE